jgi:hypothetical protein
MKLPDQTTKTKVCAMSDLCYMYVNLLIYSAICFSCNKERIGQPISCRTNSPLFACGIYVKRQSQFPKTKVLLLFLFYPVPKNVIRGGDQELMFLLRTLLCISLDLPSL